MSPKQFDPARVASKLPLLRRFPRTRSVVKAIKEEAIASGVPLTPLQVKAATRAVSVIVAKLGEKQ